MQCCPANWNQGHWPVRKRSLTTVPRKQGDCTKETGKHVPWASLTRVLYGSMYGNFSVSSHNSTTITNIIYSESVKNNTSQGGRMSRVPASYSWKSGNPKIAGSSPESTGLNPGQVKVVTIKFILVPS